ncbi:MAG: Sua5 family C-terminal domain-containing protein, partial [Inhella sp.]
DAQAPRASGTLEAHYAPRARVRLFEPAALAIALQGRLPEGLTVYSRTPWTGGPWAALPAEPEAAAQQLFATLRALDDAGAREIWVESPPSADARWAGVLDRLRRAAAAG